MKKSCRVCSWGFAFRRLEKGGVKGRCGRTFAGEENTVSGSDFCENFKPSVFIEDFFEPVEGRFGSVTYEPKGERSLCR